MNNKTFDEKPSEFVGTQKDWDEHSEYLDSLTRPEVKSDKDYGFVERLSPLKKMKLK